MSPQPQLEQAVDDLHQQIAANTDRFLPVVTIDHARLAGKAGVEMPPCIVTIFSDPETNAPLIAIDPRIGLDLPHRVLTYAEAGEGEASIAFGDASYVARRHGLGDVALLNRYEQVLDDAVAGTATDIRRPVSADGVDVGFGILEFVSEFSFDETVERLKAVVSGQDDTVWFGEVDFRTEAATQGVDVRSNTMLLFGGPAPGGMCMAEFPKLGLDAFCQKLLVFEDEHDRVRVAFNDIVAFANLHYGRNNGPQEVVNARLDAVFREATSR